MGVGNWGWTRCPSLGKCIRGGLGGDFEELGKGKYRLKGESAAGAVWEYKTSPAL